MQIVLELEPGGEERLMIDKIDEPIVLVEVGEEAVTAGRIAEGDQILGKRNLHRRAFEKHPGMPREVGTTFEETRVDLVAGRGFVVFLDRDGQRQIRGSETDATRSKTSLCGSPCTSD